MKIKLKKYLPAIGYMQYELLKQSYVIIVNEINDYERSPRILLANCISLGMMVTRFA